MPLDIWNRQPSLGGKTKRKSGAKTQRIVPSSQPTNSCKESGEGSARWSPVAGVERVKRDRSGWDRPHNHIVRNNRIVRTFEPLVEPL